MQDFFDAIDITTVFTGEKAYYLPPVDKVYMPPIARFQDPRNFYGVWAHEFAHASKAPHRLNRDYGLSRFGNTAYAREEIVAELTSVFLGQELGFTAHTLELNAAYLYNWLRVLRSDKNAIFKHAADAQRACDYLIARSGGGQGRGDRSGRMRWPVSVGKEKEGLWEGCFKLLRGQSHDHLRTARKQTAQTDRLLPSPPRTMPSVGSPVSVSSQINPFRVVWL